MKKQKLLNTQSDCVVLGRGKGWPDVLDARPFFDAGFCGRNPVGLGTKTTVDGARKLGVSPTTLDASEDFAEGSVAT